MALMPEFAVREEPNKLFVLLNDRTYIEAIHGTPDELANILCGRTHWFCGLAGLIKTSGISAAAYLSGIEVAEEQRGRGIGTAMLRAVLDRLRQLSIPEIYLHAASPASADFFAREGFMRVTCCMEDVFPVMKLTLGTARASLGADVPDPAGDWEIVDMVRAIADPIITMKPEWGIPDWLKEHIHTDRMIQNLKAAKEGKRPDMAIDSEAFAYLMTASLEAPFDSDWTALYLWLGWRVAGKKMEKLFGKPAEILTDYQQRLLDDLKRWLWTERLRSTKRGGGR